MVQPMPEQNLRTRAALVRPGRVVAGAVIALTALTLSACGGGSGASSAADLPTGLEPRPLAEPTTLTVSIGTVAEAFAAVLLADKLGEFAKENLTVDLVKLPAADSLPALAQGKTDVAAAGVGATALNAVNAGADIRLAFPGATKSPADGLYVTLDPATGEPRDVSTIATIAGPSGIATVPIGRYLESVGKSLSDVTFEQVALADMQAALEAGAVDAAWVNAPVTTVLDATGQYAKVEGYEDGEYGVGYFLGPNLRTDHPEVGQAFVRALARTVRDHLSGDYKSDDAVVAALAETMESTPEAVRKTPSMTFAAELPTDAIQAAQEDWLEIGDLLDFERPMDPSGYLDPGPLERAMQTS
jgi:NitT/TauT family transport system substrate-binding protein